MTGITEEAYPSSTAYLNRPGGLFIDSSDNMFVVEERGCRVLKFNNSGTNTLSLGNAGLCIDSENTFSHPQDVALDSSDNIWVANQNSMVQYDSSGSLLNYWSGTTDNPDFQYAYGVALDSSGRLFVADTWRHRVQVYTFTEGEPVHNGTIGVTDVSGSDNSHFDSPHRLVIDNSDRLYVIDTDNDRIQQCAESVGWSCSTFESGLSYPNGIAIDSSDNVYIVDSSNYLVRKCTSAGSCSDFITGLSDWMYDITVDSSGNIFISDYWNHVVHEYNSSAVYQGVFVGTVDTPYIPDTSRIYTPNGIAVDLDGSIYVTEDNGHRLIKLDSAGSQLWAAGHAGVEGYGTDYFASPAAGIAIDSSGRIYVPDQATSRIKIYNPDGTYNSAFGGYGTGNYAFVYPTDVTIHPINGDIYVVDSWYNRIQIYDSNWVYKATLGTAGVSGSDGTHFNSPEAVAIAASGNIYVSDSYNYRVQLCSVIGSSGSCTTFAGQTGSWGSDLEHFSSPAELAVDDFGRVYVTDKWNHRIQVFDNSGAYLTTIGGEWGSNSGQLRSPSAVALDANGDVYITDTENHRVQKFTVGVPGWDQVNINGFGDNQNRVVSALAPFSGNLFAGTINDSGSQLWRSSDGTTWNLVNTGGFGDIDNQGVDHLYEYDGKLYAGTINVDDTNGGELWRSSDGTTWNPITTNGFGSINNAEILRLFEFNSQLYVSTWVRDTGVHGVEVWRSTTGDAGSWTKVVSDGFGDSENVGVTTLEEFGVYLYASTGNYTTGGEIWRSTSGDTGSWTQVNSDGFGDSGNFTISGLATYGGYLYGITRHDVGAGSDIWRCQTCDGTDWVQVVTNGFGNAGTRGMPGLEVFNDQLYAFIGNNTTGGEVWKTGNGISWIQIGFTGFGDSNNNGPFWDNSIAVYSDKLYLGTWNHAQGGELWLLEMPEMDVSGNSISIADGDAVPSATDDTDFGGAVVISGSVSHTFTIENTGGDKLNLTGNPKIVVTGTHAADFSVSSQPSSPIAAGGNTTFEITFDPSAEGLREASVSISSDDLDENPYTFDIQGTGSDGTFSDVPSAHWAFRYVEAIADAGLTSGYPDVTYRPENPVTRAEMAVFLLNGMSITAPPINGSHPFTDIAGHWAEKYIEELYDQSITGGYPDGTYRPENLVTRAEMAVFLLKGIGVTPPAMDGSDPFIDINLHWAEIFIEELFDQGITGGYPDGTYRPENRVTRAEMAVFLVNTFNIPLP